MKQTNHAITFLAASYQAVFEKAYLKGFASSCALLAIATPYAVAADVSWADSGGNAVDVDVGDGYIQTQPESGEVFTKNLNISAESSKLSFENLTVQGNFTVEGKADSFTTSGTLKVQSSLSVTGQALLSLNDAYITSGITVGDGKSNNSGSGSSLTFQNLLSGQTSDIYVGGDITVNGATLNIKGNDQFHTQIIGKVSTEPNVSIDSQLIASTATITLDKASLAVNGAQITSGSTVHISQKAPYGSHPNTADVYTNYSNLYMGMGGDGGEQSKAVISNSTVNIGDRGLLGAAAELIFDQNSTVNLSGQIDSNVDRVQGEIDAKAILRAKTATLSDGSSINVGKNTNGGLLVQNFTVEGDSTSINVNQDAALYISGRNSYDDTFPAGALSGEATSTTYEDGKFYFNAGTINNSGNIVLGANSITVDTTTSTVTGAKVAKFLFTQSGGTFNNNGTLQIGAPNDTEATLTVGSGSGTGVQPYGEAPGTTYMGKSGTFTNAKDADIIVNQGSSLQLVGTQLKNLGDINVKSGAEFSITANSKLDNTSGSINIASGANVTIRIDALDTYQHLENSDGDAIDTAKISSLGNFANSGTITLDKLNETAAVYDVTPDQLQKVLGANLNPDQTLDSEQTDNKVRIKLSDKTSLRFDQDLDLGYDSLDQFSGGTDSSLQSTQTITYTTAENTGEDPINYDQLNGVALVAQNLVFQSTTSATERNSGSVTVFGKSGSQPVFVAAHSVTTPGVLSAEKAPLIFDNAELHLDASALNLGTGAVTFENTEDPGTVEVDLTFQNTSKLKVDDTLWEAQNITMNSGSTLELSGSLTTDSLGNLTSDPQGLTAQIVTLNSGAAATVTAGQLIAQRLLTSNGTFTATTGAIVKVTGDGDSGSVDFTGGTNTRFSNSSLDLGKAVDTLGLTFNIPQGQPTASGSFELSKDFTHFKGEAVDIYLDLSGIGTESITTAQANALFDQLVESGSGLLHLTGEVTPDIGNLITSGNGQNEIDFGELAPDGELNMSYDTEQTQSTVLTGVNNKVTGGWAAVQVSGSGSLQIKEQGTLGIYGATTAGNLVEDASGKVASVELTSGSTLMLSSSGNIGNMTGVSGTVVALDNSAKVNVVTSSGSGANVTVEKLLSAGNLTAATVTVNQAELTQGSRLHTTTLQVSGDLSAQGSTIQADNLTANNATFNGSQLQVNKDFTTSGSLSFDSGSTVKVTGTLTAEQGLQLVGDSLMEVGKLIAQSGDIQIGAESGATIASSSSNLIANRIVLNGNNLILDPEFGQKTATVFAQNIGAITTPSTGEESEDTTVSSSVMNLDGNIIVGRNSALGLGGTEDEFTQALALQQVNGSLVSGGTGAFLYVNRGNIQINDNKLIVGAEDVETLKDKLTDTASVYLGQDATMQVTTKAFNEAGASSSVFTGLESGDSIASTGGKLIVPAGTTSSDLAKLFGTEVTLEAGSSIEVTTENGLYTGTINDSDDLHGSGDFNFNISENSRAILSSLSNPTYDFVTKVLSENTTHYATEADYLAGNSVGSSTDNSGTTDGTTEDTGGNNTANEPSTSAATATTSNGISVIDNSTGYNFLREAAGSANSRAIEQSARIANLGGVMQVAMQASSTTTEAINGRLGSGQANGQNGLLTQGRTGRLWATPVYKNYSSDDFCADGLGYGPDIDLYGMAAGAEVSLSNGFNAGVMFNIGTGSADGTGIGAGINNDFSYYGFGLYGSLNLSKNFNIAADLSYTTIDNDFEANTGVANYNQLKASTDAQVLSMGLSAQYTYKSRDLMIMPHAGIRYDRIKFDDYNTQVDSNYLAHTTGATANVISIPVGVSIFKDIRDGDWIYRPSADFSVTANFGDDTVGNDTTFNGVYGAGIHYETEFIDPLVYSATLGFTAATRNFSFGASLGYTGSANTDEFAFGINGRWKF